MHSLIESKNEWCARLLNILTPMIIAGFNSIWKEAFQIATKNGEKGKYLMTFQNYLSQIPKWSSAIVEAERNRVIEKSGCTYLQDLLTCVHVIQLKALSCVRVGQRQRKVDLDIPELDVFIHNVYINCARKIYTNAYLFETDIPSLQIQKNNRELEVIIRECIVNTVRDSVPTEKILRAYMDETEEEDVETKEELVQVEGEDEDNDETDNVVSDNAGNDSNNVNKETKDETAAEPIGKQELASTINIGTEEVTLDVTEVTPPKETSVIKQEAVSEDIEAPRNLSFNDKDEALTASGERELLDAPKTIERLEKLSEEGFARRRAEEEEDDEDPLKIGAEIDLALDDIVSLEPAKF